MDIVEKYIGEAKDIMVARKLEKELPNEEAFYTEFWKSGKKVKKVKLSWSLDGSPKKLEFDKR